MKIFWTLGHPTCMYFHKIKFYSVQKYNVEDLFLSVIFTWPSHGFGKQFPFQAKKARSLRIL